MALLIKVGDGSAAVNGTIEAPVLKCPCCEQVYRLTYGEMESHHRHAWLRKADEVLRKSHKKSSHALEVLELR